MLDRDPRYDSVEDDRQRRREEEAQAAGGGDEPERESFRVPFADEGRQDDSAEREDGHSGSAREGGEERAHECRHHRETAGQPSEQGLRRPHQPRRGTSFREHVAGNRQKWDGRQRRLDDEAECLRRDRGDGCAGEEEEQYGVSRHDDEYGGTEKKCDEEEDYRGEPEP